MLLRRRGGGGGGGRVSENREEGRKRGGADEKKRARAGSLGQSWDISHGGGRATPGSSYGRGDRQSGFSFRGIHTWTRTLKDFRGHFCNGGNDLLLPLSCVAEIGPRGSAEEKSSVRLSQTPVRASESGGGVLGDYAGVVFNPVQKDLLSAANASEPFEPEGGVLRLKRALNCPPGRSGEGVFELVNITHKRPPDALGLR